MLDSSEACIGNRIMGMGGSGPSQFPFPFYLLPISDNTIICRLQTPLPDVRVHSQSPANSPWSHLRPKDAMLSHSQRTLSDGGHQRHWS